MAEKVILVLVDGMRSDAMLQCGHPFVEKWLALSSHDVQAQTVMPSVTLPCHMSLFHSVGPERHGVVTNTYTPQVRPIAGLFDQLGQFGKRCGFFYNWEELRDLCRPGCLDVSMCLGMRYQENTDARLTDAAIDYIQKDRPDFVFLYLGQTDEAGHGCGWMSEGYMQTLYAAWDCIEKVYNNLPEGYTLITTADHGGHERSHGTELEEDMCIPVCFGGSRFEKGKKLQNVSIKDISPTIAALLEVPSVREWEGKVWC